jgi:hypothetical protein
MIFFLRGLTEGTVTAMVLSSRDRREKEDSRRKPAVPRTNIIPSGQNPPRAGIEPAA